MDAAACRSAKGLRPPVHATWSACPASIRKVVSSMASWLWMLGSLNSGCVAGRDGGRGCMGQCCSPSVLFDLASKSLLVLLPLLLLRWLLGAPCSLVAYLQGAPCCLAAQAAVGDSPLSGLVGHCLLLHVRLRARWWLLLCRRGGGGCLVLVEAPPPSLSSFHTDKGRGAPLPRTRARTASLSLSLYEVGSSGWSDPKLTGRAPASPGSLALSVSCEYTVYCVQPHEHHLARNQTIAATARASKHSSKPDLRQATARSLDKHACLSDAAQQKACRRAEYTEPEAANNKAKVKGARPSQSQGSVHT